MTIIKTIAASLVAAGLLVLPAAAQEQKVLGEFQDWVAVSYTENGQDVCYIYSFPKTEVGDYTRRGAAYVQVTRRGGNDVVSFEAGYPYKLDNTVTVRIDADSPVTLFTHADTPETAWAPDDATDGILVNAMRRGSQMVVRGTSSRGTDTTDTYSLMGFTAAHQAMAAACGG